MLRRLVVCDDGRKGEELGDETSPVDVLPSTVIDGVLKFRQYNFRSSSYHTYSSDNRTNDDNQEYESIR